MKYEGPYKSCFITQITCNSLLYWHGIYKVVGNPGGGWWLESVPATFCLNFTFNCVFNSVYNAIFLYGFIAFICKPFRVTQGWVVYKFIK